jgi:hypothetical protein
MQLEVVYVIITKITRFALIVEEYAIMVIVDIGQIGAWSVQTTFATRAILCDHISLKKKAAYDIMPERGTAEFEAISEASDKDYEALNVVVQKALLEALVSNAGDSEEEPDLDLADLYSELCDINQEHMTEQNCNLYCKLMLSITVIVDLT